MFHTNDLDLALLEQKLRKKMGSEVIPQPILMRDIYIQTKIDYESFGESKHHRNTYQKLPSFQRLLDHIGSLARIANVYHQKYNCTQEQDGTYSIKEDSRNKVTRILLNEFSLHASKPLTVEEFTLLRNKLKENLADIHDNVHLLLSSFSVVTDNSENLNIVLYVECGEKFKIHQFCKSGITRGDVKYEGTCNTSKEEFIKEANVLRKTIRGNSVTIKLLGGAKYEQYVLICADIYVNNYKELLQFYEQQHLALPDTVDQILTSNFVMIAWQPTAQFIESSLAHADPKRNAYPLVQNDIVTISDLKRVKNKYMGMTLATQEYNCVEIISLAMSPVAKPNTLLLVKIKYPANHPCYSIKKKSEYGLVLDGRWLNMEDAEKILDILTKHQSANDTMRGFLLDSLVPLDYLQRIKSPELVAQITTICRKQGISVENPPFGSDYNILVTEERKLGGFRKEIKSSLDKNNGRIIKDQLKAQLASNDEQIVDQYEILLELSHLYKTLLWECGPSENAGQSLFENKAAAEMKKIIVDSFKQFEALKEKDVEHTLQSLPVLLKALRVNLENINHKKGENLVNKIDAFIQVNQEIEQQKPVQLMPDQGMGPKKH